MTRTSDRPLPDGHPFKGTRIIFGQKRPDSSESNSAPPRPSEPIEPPAVDKPIEQDRKKPAT